MHLSSRARCLASAALLAVWVAAPAAAEEADAPNTVSTLTVEGKGLGLETRASGSRLELTPLETPASIEVISGEQIRQRGDRLLTDAITRATGITSTAAPGNGGTALASRGFSGQGSVMLLRDGIRLYVGAGTITFPFDTWTVDRIEVLRGPASVLYGEGAIGGAVNVISRRPEAMPRFDAQVGAGSRDTWRAAVGGGMPINDRMAFRVDAAYDRSDGYVDRGRSESLAISGAVELRATDDLTFTLSHDYGDNKPMAYFGTPLINGRLDERNARRNFNVADYRMKFTDNWTQLRAEYAPTDTVTVRNVLYRSKTDRNYYNVEAYAFQPASNMVRRSDYIAIGHDQEQWGDRADITLKHELGGWSNQLVVGGEVNKIDFTHSSNTPFGGTSLVDPFNPVPGLFVVTVPFINRYNTDTDTYALFVEDRLEISDQVALVGGLRYDNADFERRDLITNATFGNVFKDLTGRIGLVWTPSDTLSIYGQYGTGTDPLGSLITSNTQQASFDNATARQFEVGVKQVFWGGRGQWTLAAYDIVKKNLLSRDPLNPTVTQQIGARSSQGVEAAVTAELGSGWTVDANVALLDADFDDFDELVAGALVSREGKTPPGVPEKTANLWVSWDATSALRASAGVRYVGRRYVDNANTITLPSYTVVDADVRWQVNDSLAAHVSVRNLTKETYAVTGGAAQWLLGAPRSFEVRLTARY